MIFQRGNGVLVSVKGTAADADDPRQCETLRHQPGLRVQKGEFIIRQQLQVQVIYQIFVHLRVQVRFPLKISYYHLTVSYRLSVIELSISISTSFDIKLYFRVLLAPRGHDADLWIYVVKPM